MEKPTEAVNAINQFAKAFEALNGTILAQNPIFNNLKEKAANLDEKGVQDIIKQLEAQIK